MNSFKLLRSSPLLFKPGTSGFRALFIFFLILSFLPTQSLAQYTTHLLNDTAKTNDQSEFMIGHTYDARIRNTSYENLSLEWDSAVTALQRKKRIRLVAAANIVGYSGTMTGLYSAWYKNYPQSGFHTFNDNREWLQVDKVGHIYSAYIESRGSMELWRWTGIDHKKRIWLGGLSGAVYQTVIETLDGFSAGWGWSWGDFTANILGSGTLIAQELAWNDQRIKLKFSSHRRNYGNAELDKRSDVLYGRGDAERYLKDYNGQTYWASINLKPFFKNSKLPAWLSLAVGYGADGMFGAEKNIGKDKDGNIIFDRQDIKRYRQWYLAPDIDLSKIKTKSKALNFFLTVLSAFKFPTPSIELSNGKLRAHAIHF